MAARVQHAAGFVDNIMCSGPRSLRISVLLLICFAASPAWSAFDETYRLRIGGLVTDFETSLRINSRDDSIDSEIDLEDDLGFDSDIRTGSIRGFWRIADRHQLSLLYTSFKRSSEATTATDIEIGGNVIKAGAYVGASVKTHVFDIEYLYSFFKRPDIELGVTAGFYWMNSVAELNAFGEVIFEGETTPEFRTDYAANQRLVAPLPLLGVTAGYEVNESWRITAAARFLDVSISDVDGRILSSNLATEYYFTRHVGVGAALAFFDLDVQYNGVVFINTLSYEYSGLQVYMSLKY